jgi:hypothetical protein
LKASLGRTYNRWSAAEEAYFLGLCEKHGEGKWAQMLAEGQQAGKLRADLTSTHLRDKYRNLKTKRALDASRAGHAGDRLFLERFVAPLALAGPSGVSTPRRR